MTSSGSVVLQAGIFLKLKFSDFSRTSIDRAGLEPTLENYEQLLNEAFVRSGKPVRLIGVGVRFVDTGYPGTARQIELPLG